MGWSRKSVEDRLAKMEADLSSRTKGVLVEVLNGRGTVIASSSSWKGIGRQLDVIALRAGAKAWLARRAERFALRELAAKVAAQEAVEAAKVEEARRAKCLAVYGRPMRRAFA